MHYPDLSALAPLLNDISLDVPWALIERFSALKRQNPEDVRRAAFEIVGRLAALGAPATIEEPELFLSLPRSASISSRDRSYRAKALSMSRSVPSGLNGQLVYAPLPDTRDEPPWTEPPPDLDVASRIVLAHGFGEGTMSRYFELRGATGLIAISPGHHRHWESCSTVRGSPDLTGLSRKPGLVVVSVSHADGQALIDRARAGEFVTLFTELEEGWFPSPIPLLRIPGTEEPGPFVLLHAHYDAWEVGVGDNATGNAVLLEVARVLWRHRDRLRRSVWIAWWPGHATGGLAGSAWFADRYAVDLYERCIAQVGCLSPGCRAATEYADVPAMPEACGWTLELIRRITGTEGSVAPPQGAIDSFDNVGISGFLSRSSVIPAAERAARGFYPVPGCGGNVVWHTEDDLLAVADRTVLLTDLKLYLAAVAGTANATIAPFDYGLLMDELSTTLQRYQRAAGNLVSFDAAWNELDALKQRLQRFAQYCAALERRPASDAAVRRANAALRRLGRLLVPVSRTTGPAFFHDPTGPVALLPDLATALDVPRTPAAHRGVLRTHLGRGQNRLLTALRDASAVVRGAMA